MTAQQPGPTGAPSIEERHRAEIGPLQTPSAETAAVETAAVSTVVYAGKLEGKLLGACA